MDPGAVSDGIVAGCVCTEESGVDSTKLPVAVVAGMEGLGIPPEDPGTLNDTAD